MKNGETRKVDRIQGLENPKRGNGDKRKVFESKGGTLCTFMYLYVPLCTFLKKKVWCHLYEYMVGFSCLHGKGWGKKMHFWF